MKLGVFTACMPEYWPLDALAKCAELGYEGIEWPVKKDTGDKSKPTFWSGNRTRMPAEEIIEKAQELKARAASLGMQMPSLGTYLYVDEVEGIEMGMKAARAVDAGHIRVSPGGYKPERGTYPELVAHAREKYARVAELAARHGVRAVIETHMNQLAPSVTKAMSVLRGLDPLHVGIMWDPGNQVIEGLEVYRMAVEEAGPYLAEVHVKNMRHEKGKVVDGRQTWKPAPCPLREGVVDWPAVIGVLKSANYDGWLFVEDFSTAVPLDQRLKDDHDWLRGLLA